MEGKKTLKLAELEAKKQETEEKLKAKMKGFRGVIHESASSEQRYMEIKVLESHLESLSKEIESLKSS